MKKIKSYTGIWNVEKVLYAINDFNLPFPVTFTQITWFVITEFISHYGTLEEVVEHKDDIYYYPDCETMTDVAYYYIDELQALGDIPHSLQNYIDYEAYGRDLDMGGCFIETSRGMCEIPY